MLKQFCVVSILFLSIFPARLHAMDFDPEAEPNLDLYQNGSSMSEVSQPDPVWLSENQDIVDESLQAVRNADRMLKAEKTSMFRLMEVAQDCETPGKWQRDKEHAGSMPENVVAFSEAEVYKNARTPYVVKIIKSTCSGDTTDTSFYFYRKDRTLAYLYEAVDTYEDGKDGPNGDKPIRIERHIYYNKSGKQLARYEKTLDAKSGEIIADSQISDRSTPQEYLKAKSLPFFGLL